MHTVAPLLAIALVEVATERGLNEIYQLPIALRPEGEASAAAARSPSSTAGRPTTRPPTPRSRASSSTSSARPRPRAARTPRSSSCRPAGPDSVPVPAAGDAARRSARATRTARSSYGEELVLKVYRLLSAGDNPEVELLQFLNRHGFPNTPALLGSYEHSGRLIDATLGILTRFVPAECDGWTFALSSLAGDPSRFLETLDAARRGHRLDARRARIRLERSRASRPRSRAAESLRAARGHARRGDRGRLRAPARERGAGADRLARGGGARARARSSRA